MLRALIAVCLWASLAQAAPKYDRGAIRTTEPSLVAAEKAWTDAAAEKDLFHRHLGYRDGALLELRACVAAARRSMAGSEWLARCERDLAAMKEPDLDVLPERLARPSAAPVIAVEQLRARPAGF